MNKAIPFIVSFLLLSGNLFSQFWVLDQSSTPTGNPLYAFFGNSRQNFECGITGYVSGAKVMVQYNPSSPCTSNSYLVGQITISGNDGVAAYSEYDTIYPAGGPQYLACAFTSPQLLTLGNNYELKVNIIDRCLGSDLVQPYLVLDTLNPYLNGAFVNTTMTFYPNYDLVFYTYMIPIGNGVPNQFCLSKPPLPTISGNQAICSNETAYLVANGVNTDNYSWFINGVTALANEDSLLISNPNSGGTIKLVAKNTCGVSDTAIVTITVLNANGSSQSISACENYNWQGNNYFNSGTYFDTLSNMNGCDSIITLNLTIKNNTTATDVHSACDSFTWIDGFTYTASNSTATYLLQNFAGCDSLVYLDLTINSIGNTSLVQSNDSLLVINNSANFQWLDCQNNYAQITGANTNFFIPSFSGDFAVELSENGCVDTSSCINYVIVGELDPLFENRFVIYPNPASDQIRIEDKTEKIENAILIRIQNNLGQVVYEENADHFPLDIHFSKNYEGIFSLQLMDEWGLVLESKLIMFY